VVKSLKYARNLNNVPRRNKLCVNYKDQSGDVLEAKNRPPL